MWRGIRFFVLLALLAALAVWAAGQTGSLSLEWFGYRVSTRYVALLPLAVLLLAALAALLYRAWRMLLGAPRQIGRSLEGSRRERGYRALTQGLVAVAAGDAREAQRWSRKAETLLNEPPLTRLLAAQAAQLNGDEATARRFFTEMLESPDTRFLGLRGLLMQALRDGDEAAAQDYLQQARALRPDTPWVLSSLVDMSVKTGDLAAAEGALRDAARHKALPAGEAERKRAAVLVQRARQGEAEGRIEAATRDAQAALKLAPDLLPATVTLGRLLHAANRPRKAAGLLLRAWGSQPHPELAEVYMSLYAEEKPLERIKRAQKLAAQRPDDPESHLALARAALAAELWGEARRHLDAATGEGGPDHRICALMAELEQREHGDAAAAADWLRRAEAAEPDPTWVCGSCGAAAAVWDARCGACEAFDSLAWGRPPRVAVALPASEGGTAIAAVATVSEAVAETVPETAAAAAEAPIGTPTAASAADETIADAEVSELPPPATPDADSSPPADGDRADAGERLPGWLTSNDTRPDAVQDPAPADARAAASAADETVADSEAGEPPTPAPAVAATAPAPEPQVSGEDADHRQRLPGWLTARSDESPKPGGGGGD